MIGKRLINTGVAAEAGAFTPSENFETVLYTGNGGTQRIGGYINRGAVFNGSNSEINLGSNMGLANNSFSVSLWIANTQSGSTDSHFFGDYGPAGANTALHIGRRHSTGKLTFAFYLNDLDSSTNVSTDGTWQHWVCTYDASTNSRKIYLNGTLDASDTASADYQGTSNLRLGRMVSGSYALGKLDQVRIFNKALSSSEVTTLYGETYASSTVSTTDIFSDNSGVALYQLDGNANDTGGTYNGTATNVTYQEATKFQPDLVWIKDRSAAISHQVHDSVRGATKVIKTNLTNAESTDSAGLTSFDTNGFSIGANTGINNNTNNYVAWCFKGGGTAVSNTDGSITSQVSANTAAGFSIVKHTAPSSEQNYTIGHGLSQKPDMVILKGLDSASAWFVWHKDLSVESYYLYLHLTADESGLTQDTRIWGQQSFTDTVISTRANYTTALNQDYISYCFHSVDGYSKIGSYVGDGNESGNHIVTGFEPQFVMIKATENVSDWIIFDTERDSVNPTTKILYANLSSAEQDGITDRTPDLYIEVTSNGFQIKGLNNDINVSGETFIYLAIAADPDTTTPTVENSFDVVTYTGDGTTSRQIDADFKPDLVWIKSRSSASWSHFLQDSVRGAENFLISASTGAEATTLPNIVSSFNDDGFVIENNGNSNTNGDTYVAWCWKAGDHDDNLPQINTEGSIDSVVSVNAAAGFSIVKYTGSGSAGMTVGHGLSSAPEIVIIKNLTTGGAAYAWQVFGGTLFERMVLNDTVQDQNNFGCTFSATTFQTTQTSPQQGNPAWNGSGENYIAYCFHSVSGYQKIGSYTGSGTTSKVVTIGFTPRFLMIKNADNTGDWAIFDSQRSPSNPVNDRLMANLSSSESTDSTTRVIDFDATSFELKTSNQDINASGDTYIYLAIA